MAKMDSGASLGHGTAAPPARNTIRYTLAGMLFGLLFPVVATAMSLAQSRLSGRASNLISVQASEPLLWIIDAAPLFLGLLGALAGRRQDAYAERNAQLVSQQRELSSLKTTLEEGVAQRTQQLTERNQEIQAAVHAAHEIAELHDPATLLTSAVALLAQNFKGYEADAYLLEDRGNTAVLAASSSSAGSHRAPSVPVVKVGDASMIGQVAVQGRRITSWRPGTSEAMSDETSPAKGIPEVALALVSRGRILGVLDLRHVEPEVTPEVDTEILQLLADQLAAAIDGARVLDEARVSLRQLEQLSGQTTRTAWQEFLRQRGLTLEYTPAGIKALDEGAKTRHPLDVQIPLVVRGQQIGSLAFQRKSLEAWTQDDLDLARKVATQVALALENTRLLEETRERAASERRLTEMSDRFSRSADIDTLLQTAVRELAALPEVSDATVFLSPGTGSDGGAPE
jgi:GAF domain-containing protein